MQDQQRKMDVPFRNSQPGLQPRVQISRRVSTITGVDYGFE